MPACPWCGAKVRWFDLSCRQCGTRHEKLRDWMEIGALVVVLAAAIPSALYIATHHRPSSGLLEAPMAPAPVASPPVAPPAASQTTPAEPPADNYAWLERAMQACDDEASKDKEGLYFLMIPLELLSGNIPNWRPRNVIGNALVMLGKDTLDGLKQKLLAISKDEYVLGVRNMADQSVHLFERAVGVKQFRHPDPKTISSFKLQFRTKGEGRDDDWGNPLDRHAGVCFWVPALARH